MLHPLKFLLIQKKKISLEAKKKPISPYGKAKLISFNKTKFFRKKNNIKAYNAILFNTESYYRDKKYKSFIRRRDFITKKSNFKSCLKRNNIKRTSKIFGKKIIYLLIKYYLNEKT